MQPDKTNNTPRSERILLTWHRADGRTVSVDEAEAWFSVAKRISDAALDDPASVGAEEAQP